MRSRLTDLGVAAIPCALGLAGPGTYDAGWSLALGAGIGASLYWRRRSPFAVLAACFAFGLIQLAAALSGGPRPRVLPGLYDLGIIIAIYSAVAYGSRAARLVAVAGGTTGAAVAALVWVTGVRDTRSQVLAVFVLWAPVLLAWALGTAARTRRAYASALRANCTTSSRTA